jgi:hypothetical protein
MDSSDVFHGKPIRFSFSKDPLRRCKPNVSSIRTATSKTNHHYDQYDDSPTFIEELIHQIQSNGFENFSLKNPLWTRDVRVPLVPQRTASIVHRRCEEQKIRQRVSSIAKEWRSTYTNYNTHYHDFDRPEE